MASHRNNRYGQRGKYKTLHFDTIMYLIHLIHGQRLTKNDQVSLERLPNHRTPRASLSNAEILHLSDPLTWIALVNDPRYVQRPREPPSDPFVVPKAPISKRVAVAAGLQEHSCNIKRAALARNHGMYAFAACSFNREGGIRKQQAIDVTLASSRVFNVVVTRRGKLNYPTAKYSSR